MFIQYLQTRCVLLVDLLMDQIILTCAAIIDFPGAKHFKYTSLVWNSNQINRAFFCFVFIFIFFVSFFFGSSIAMGGMSAGADPGFQVRRGALKKIAPSEGRRENLWGISCEKSRFYAKKSYFSNIRGGGRTKFLGYFMWKITILSQKNLIFSNFRGRARRVRPPPWIRPWSARVALVDLLYKPV